MDIYRVSFTGHREIRQVSEIEARVREIVRELISTKEYVEFYLGRNGDFDILATSVIRTVQKKLGYENSSLILVLPYRTKDDDYYELYYDEVLMPIDSKTHFKAAITKRNQWIVDNTDLLIAYVERPYGGAHSTLKYAQKKQVETINIYKNK